MKSNLLITVPCSQQCLTPLCASCPLTLLGFYIAKK